MSLPRDQMIDDRERAGWLAGWRTKKLKKRTGKGREGEFVLVVCVCVIFKNKTNNIISAKIVGASLSLSLSISLPFRSIICLAATRQTVL